MRRSLFDNSLHPSMEANLEYMFKKFGFYFPDAEYLVDPEGLLKYLVSQYGVLSDWTLSGHLAARWFSEVVFVGYLLESWACSSTWSASNLSSWLLFWLL